MVVLLHGSPNAGISYFEPLTADLARDHRVMVPEFPGYGQSPMLNPYSLGAVQQELERDLVARGVTQAAVVGFSAGAWRGLNLAVHSRQIRITHLMLQGGFAALTPEHKDGLAGFGMQLRAMKNGIDPAFRQQVAQLMLSAAYSNTHPDAAAAVGGWLDVISPDDLATELISWKESEDLRPQLPRIQAKITARTGEADVAVPIAYAEEIVRNAPGAVLERVPGAGHALLIEDCAATITATRAAITRS